MIGLDPLMSSNTPEWYTPACIIERAIRVLGSIDLDPCSNSEGDPVVPAATHYSRAEDGLAQPWRGRVYMNPPYGREIGRWVRKLADEYRAGRVCGAVALLPARTDTAWMAELRSFPRCYIRGRLKFSGHANSAPFPSVIMALGCDLAAFRAAFGDLGDIYLLAEGTE